MAQDLEDVKNPNAKPVSRPIAMPKSDGKNLSEILTQAQKRMQTPLPEPSAPTPNLEEILPIEPLDTARRRPASPTGGPFPSTAPTALREPPLNLPTGLPEVPARMRTDIPPKPQASVSGDIKRKESPEEILGLNAPKPREAKLSGKTPMKEGAPTESPSIAPSPKKNLISKKFVLVTGVLSIILFAIAGGIYWKIFLQKTPLEPNIPIPPPQITEQPAPEALISYAATEFIEINEISYSVLKTKLDALKDIPFPPEFLVYAPIKLRTDKKISYLTLQEFFAGLKINAPQTLLAQIKEEFNLFLYSQGAEAERSCVDAGILDKQCYGPRLGLVIRIYDRDQAFSIMRDWEKTMVSDLDPIMLYEPQEKPGGSFKAGKHKDLETNFINLPIPSMSIDWIISDNYLIIATSKEAARSASDRLK